MEWTLRTVRGVFAEEERSEGKLIRASNQKKERIMLRTRLAAMFIPLFITGAALADNPKPMGADTTEGAAKVSATFSTLETVNKWAINISEMADKRAKSDLVKSYAHTVATANTIFEQKLDTLAQKHGMDIAPPGPAPTTMTS